MVDKRRRKAYGLRQQVIKPVSSGPENPDILLLCWGSSKGAVREAAQLLTENGLRTGSIHFSQVWPLEPDHFLSLLQQAGQVINVESNASGQFAALIRQETGFEVSGSILRYDGLPLTAGYIIQKLHALYKESGYGSSQ